MSTLTTSAAEFDDNDDNGGNSENSENSAPITPAGPAGFDDGAFDIETVAEVLCISAGRAKKLRDLQMLDVHPGAQGRRERYTGRSVSDLAYIRNRPLKITRPTLVCSLGVESWHSGVPSLEFRRDTKWGIEAFKELDRGLTDEQKEALTTRELRVTGWWKVSDADAERLVAEKSFVVGLLTGFILEGGPIVAEVPVARGTNGGRAFLYRPADRYQRYDLLRRYYEPPVGPPSKVVKPDQDEPAGDE